MPTSCLHNLGEERLRRRREREGQRRATETAAEREERLARRKVRDRARYAAKTREERAAHNYRKMEHHISHHWKLIRTYLTQPAPPDPRRFLYAASISTARSRSYITTDSPAANNQLDPTTEDSDPFDAHFAELFVPNAARSMTEQEW